jgi:type II secretory pathway pseudopilin PulG
MRVRTRAPKGFTVLELGIGLALMGLLMGVALPTLGALSGAELKKSTGLLQGLVRDTYARTALSGRPHRIVFDLEADTYWVEETSEVFRLRATKQELDREGNVALDVLDERAEDAAGRDDAESREKLRLFSGPSWNKVADEVGQVTHLPSDVRFFGVWVEHLSERAKGGQTALHFFPGGYTEEAQVTLTDDDDGDRTRTLVTQPLTGEVHVENEIPEMPHDWGNSHR